MDKESKKKLAVIVFCFSLAIILFYFFVIKGGSSSDSFKEPGVYYMICNSPKCAETFELTAEEYRAIDDNAPAGVGMMSLNPPSALICSACKQQSLFRAIKCEECGVFFLPNFMTDDYSDRCPDCGYSKMEDISK